MKMKKIVLIMLAILAGMCIFSFSNKVNAVKISNDGKYTLVLNVEDGEIDGRYSKLIRFDFDEGESTVKLSELTKGIIPFNGQNEFAYWGKSIFKDEKAEEELKKEDFNVSGTSGDESYTNGLVLWAKFSDKKLQGTGTYYLTLNPFAGKIDGKDNLRLTSKSTEFKTVDLSKYKPVREGHTFVGWDYNGKFVKSIDSSYFKECDAIEVTAVYTKDTYEGDYLTLNLNANGGKIDGKDSNLYDYVGGSNSGTSMVIFQYVPVREGYTFNGWNTKKDGSGKNYKYMYWGFWRNDGTSEFEKENFNDGIYRKITLYASWSKNPETEETIKEINSTSDTNGSIKFEEGINKNYRLDIQKVEVKNELANNDVKFIADINVLDGNNIVKINDTKMKIKIAMPEDLKGYDQYEVVYILNDEIKETLPATVEDGYIIFETTHLSQYGIVAKNVKQEENEKSTNIVKNETNNPKTGDNIIVNMVLFISSAIAICTFFIVNRKNK